jgi:hypothetical protein
MSNAPNIRTCKNHPAFGIGPNPQKGYREGKWAIFHMPSGSKVTDSNSNKTCVKIVEELDKLGNWNLPIAEIDRQLKIDGARYIILMHCEENWEK